MSELKYFSEYREQVTGRTAAKNGRMIPLNVIFLGLAGEAGEVADLLKKHEWHGKELPREELLKELGDVLWYVDALALAKGWTMEHVVSADELDIDDPVPVDSRSEAVLDLVSEIGATWEVGQSIETRHVRSILFSLIDLVGACNFTMSAVATANRDKLHARYPNGFVEGGGIR